MDLGSELKEYARQLEESADRSLIPDVAGLTRRMRRRRRVARVGAIGLAASAVVSISIGVTASTNGGAGQQAAGAYTRARAAGIACGDAFALPSQASDSLALRLTLPTAIPAGDSRAVEVRLANVGDGTVTVSTAHSVRFVVVKEGVVVGYWSAMRGSLARVTLSPGVTADVPTSL